MESLFIGHSEEAEKQKLQIIEYEKEVMALRRRNDELDTKVKTGQAKVTTLENSITSVQTEVAKLTALNDKLQKEKQSIMRLVLFFIVSHVGSTA